MVEVVVMSHVVAIERLEATVSRSVTETSQKCLKEREKIEFVNDIHCLFFYS